MKIKTIPHKTLAEAAASKLAVSLLDGSLTPGTQLPPERELMNQLGISRTTVREALKTLEENNLIESRPNVGWFARTIDESNRNGRGLCYSTFPPGFGRTCDRSEACTDQS